MIPAAAPDARTEGSDRLKTGIAGGGSIGAGWAVVFSRAGFEAAVFEPDPARRSVLPAEIEHRLRELEAHGLMDEDPVAAASRVSVGGDLGEMVDGAAHVQECAPESLDLKTELFRRLDSRAAAGTTLASSSSTLTISEIAAGLPGRGRCLLAHPGNPPYLLPVVELAPAPFTDPSAVESAARLMRAAGMSPVMVRREVEGLVFNRLQGALLREALCLVRDGVVSPADLDLLVTRGLGRRWSVIGPFAVAELNTRGGIRAHARVIGQVYARIGLERGRDDPWTPQVIDEVAGDLESRFPSARWEHHGRWRDRELMKLQSALLRRAEGSPSEGGGQWPSGGGQAGRTLSSG